jgi:hypothetical protein
MNQLFFVLRPGEQIWAPQEFDSVPAISHEESVITYIAHAVEVD